MAEKELDLEDLKKLRKRLETLGVKNLEKLREKLKTLGGNDDVLALIEKTIASVIEQKRHEEERKELIAEYDEKQQKVTDEQIAAIAQEIVKQAENIQKMASMSAKNALEEAIRNQKEMDYLARQIQNLSSRYQQLSEEHNKHLAQIKVYDLQLEESWQRVAENDEHIEALHKLYPAVSKQEIKDLIKKIGLIIKRLKKIMFYLLLNY